MASINEVEDDLITMSAYDDICDVDEDNDFLSIRFEKQPDECLAEIQSRNDVIERIKHVREQQSRYGQATVYNRSWDELNLAAVSEKADSSSSGCKNGTTITVLQFNTLAEGLSAGPDAMPPFRSHDDSPQAQHDKKAFGGLSDVPHPNIVLSFNQRRWRILEVILGSDGSAVFDIIALQEVDRYVGFFAPIMQIFGYRGVFAPKTRSPGVKMGWYSDGCCLFWKEDMFELLDQRRVEYMIGNQVFLIVRLRHRPSLKDLVLLVTHLKAQKNETNELIRCQQVDELLHYANSEASLGSDETPIIILGDFNADNPQDCAGNQSSVRRLLEYSVEGMRKYTSAYEIDPPKQGFYTTWKTRGTTTVRRIIDYIFFSGRLRCVANLRVPAEEELEKTKLPGLRYPSDHMAIGAKFELV